MIGIFMNYKIILSVMPTYLASNINAHHILIPLNYFLHKMKKKFLPHHILLKGAIMIDLAPNGPYL